MKEINGIKVEFGKSIPSYIIREFKMIIGSVGFKKIADRDKIKRVEVNRYEWFADNQKTDGKFIEVEHGDMVYLGKALYR